MRYFYFVIFYFYSFIVFAQKPLIISNAKESYLVTDYASISTIDIKVCNLNDVAFLSSFKPIQKKYINDYFWIKFDVVNQLSTPSFLDIGTSIIDSIEVIAFDTLGNTILHKNKSKFDPFDNELDVANFVFQLPNVPKFTCFMRVVLRNSQLIVPIVRPSEAAINHYNNFGIFNGMYYGFLFLITGYNLIIYFSIRDKIYLYYIFSSLGMGLVNSIINSYAYQYLWPKFPLFNFYTNSVLSLGGILICLFLTEFFKTKNNSPKLHQGYLFIIFLFIVTFILDLFRFQSQSAFIAQIASLGVAFYTLIVSLILYFNGVKSALYIIVAWSFYLLSVMFVVLMYWGLIPFFKEGEYLIQFGTCLEIFTLSLAIGAKINEYKSEVIKAEKDKVSLLEENERYILNSNKELSRQNSRLKQYSYITSHNLRAPVASLLGITKVFNKSKLDDPFNAVLIDKINECANNLDRIIFDLTDILHNSDIELQSFELVDLSDKLDEVLLSLELEIRSHNITIIKDFSCGKKVNAIPSFVHSIFFNLINNAIKYGSDNQPTITIKTFLKDGYFCLSIKDNGIGIDVSSNKEKLFGLYQRFHFHKQGRGMGLFMVRSHIESMNGFVDIESEVGKGTNFILHFPISNKVNV